jgi:hypothetical protein
VLSESEHSWLRTLTTLSQHIFPIGLDQRDSMACVETSSEEKTGAIVGTMIPPSYGECLLALTVTARLG